MMHQIHTIPFLSRVECPTEQRVKKWKYSLENLISDQLGEFIYLKQKSKFFFNPIFSSGVSELMSFMKKEYSHENLRFWLSVQELKTGPGSEAKIKKKVKEIWE